MQTEKSKNAQAAPILKQLLIAAFVLYVISSTQMLVSLINKVGTLEHQMMHLRGADKH